MKKTKMALNKAGILKEEDNEEEEVIALHSQLHFIGLQIKVTVVQ